MLGASVSAGRAVGSADTSSFMHLPLPTGITLGHSTPEHVKLVYFETIFEFHLTEYLLAFLSLAFQCCIAIVSHKPSPQESVTPPSRHKLRRPLCQYPLCSHALREHLPSASMWLASSPLPGLCISLWFGVLLTPTRSMVSGSCCSMCSIQWARNIG